MDGSTNPPLDYQQAADRLLVALSFIATRLPERPVPAVNLVAHCFDYATRIHWKHETRRRRIRDTVIVARQQLRSRQTPCAVVLSANGQGYWLTGDRQVIAWYAAQRRRAGLTDLAAESQAKEFLSAQASLFS